MFEPSMAEQKKQRQKAKELKKSRWWANLTQSCACYYCQKPLDANTVTMDHIVPISRGGKSQRSNLVPACHACNHQKRSLTPVEWLDFIENKLEKH